MKMSGHVRRTAAAVAVALALVAGVGSLQGANATAIGTTASPVDAAVRAVQQLQASPSYLAAERAALAGQPVPLDAKRTLEADLTTLVSSSTFAAAARQLGPLLADAAIGDRGVPEFTYHLNQGNQRMLAAVNVITVLVVPGVLGCPIGQPTCVTLWVLVGAGLASGAVVSGAQEYVQAVLSLP